MAKCKGCGADITWIKTRLGKSMPVDEKPVPYFRGTGDKIVTEDGDVISCDLNGTELIGFGYVSHFVTCPQADRFRRKKHD